MNSRFVFFFQLSQILGHSEQLYIRLPRGLRIWQFLLALMFTVIGLWVSFFAIVTVRNYLLNIKNITYSILLVELLKLTFHIYLDEIYEFFQMS